MIRTKKTVLWNAQKRMSGIVYLDTTDRKEPSGVNRDRVIFEITQYVLETYTERVTIEELLWQKDGLSGNFVLDNSGNKIPVLDSNNQQLKILVFKNKTWQDLRPIMQEYPDYRSETFYTLFPALKPEDYDGAMIAQIDYNNSLLENNRNYYWDLTSPDFEIVTPAMLQALRQPVFTDI